MRKRRTNYSAEEKVSFLRRPLVDRVSVLNLCDELQLQPTVFYRWLKEFLRTLDALRQIIQR